MLSGVVEDIVLQQQAFYAGSVALAQNDIIKAGNIYGSLPDNKESKFFLSATTSSILGFYGAGIVKETGSFYNRLRSFYTGEPLGDIADRIPNYNDTYNIRRDSAINLNINLQANQAIERIIQQMVDDVVRNMTYYQQSTVDFIGYDDKEYVKSSRIPRADACAFCRLKATEFPSYSSKQEIMFLDGISLHKSCRCVLAPIFTSTQDTDYLTKKQEDFEDKLLNIASKNGINVGSQRNENELLSLLRKEFKQFK